MKAIITGAIITMAAAATPALAWEGKKVACYDKVWVPATYKSKKVLEYPAKKKWEHHDGQMVKMRYPAIYMVKKYVDMEGHYELHKAPCK
ncbi:hypothetical protein [Roseovarius salinarum]|uniref:hypothetical protein n=1 Tax=Roseovarius salinarum TaxID=1981892 RepID=UPI0012FFDB7A|nr:hypothetical protein [Roseovarius salinarum]